MVSLLVVLTSLLIPSIILYVVLVYYKIPLPQDKFFSANSAALEEKTSSSFSKVLLVTAHPDDEVMFFAPALLYLKEKPHIQVHILCLSSGEFDGLGDIRKKELIKAGEVLGISSDRIMVYNDSRFPDNPNKLWAPQEVSDAVEKYIADNEIRTVLTFDDKGVSGHMNHIAIRYAIGHLLKTSTQLANPKKAVTVYELETVPIIRKYISLGDLLFSLSKITYDRTPLIHTAPDVLVPKQLFFVSRPGLVFQARASMKAHNSQMVWFRHLYIFFSRYMVINNFHKVNPTLN